MQLMTSEEAYRLAQEDRPVPADVAEAEALITDLERHISGLSPTVSRASPSVRDALTFTRVGRRGKARRPCNE